MEHRMPHPFAKCAKGWATRRSPPSLSGSAPQGVLGAVHIAGLFRTHVCQGDKLRRKCSGTGHLTPKAKYCTLYSHSAQMAKRTPTIRIDLDSPVPNYRQIVDSLRTHLV